MGELFEKSRKLIKKQKKLIGTALFKHENADRIDNKFRHNITARESSAQSCTFCIYVSDGSLFLVPVLRRRHTRLFLKNLAKISLIRIPHPFCNLEDFEICVLQ